MIVLASAAFPASMCITAILGILAFSQNGRAGSTASMEGLGLALVLAIVLWFPHFAVAMFMSRRWGRLGVGWAAAASALAGIVTWVSLLLGQDSLANVPTPAPMNVEVQFILPAGVAVVVTAVLYEMIYRLRVSFLGRGGV